MRVTETVAGYVHQDIAVKSFWAAADHGQHDYMTTFVIVLMQEHFTVGLLDCTVFVQ